jgi:WD40 repeat protein
MKKMFFLIVILFVHYAFSMNKAPRLNLDKAHPVTEKWIKGMSLNNLEKTDIQFSPSGKNFITSFWTSEFSKVTLWDVNEHSEKCSFKVNFEIFETFFDKKETQIFCFDSDKKMMCFDVAKKKISWSKIEKTGIYRPQIIVSDDGNKMVQHDWYRAVFLDFHNSDKNMYLFDHHDQANNNTITVGFDHQLSRVTVFHNGFLSDYQDSECVAYKALIPATAYCPIYMPEEKKLLYFDQQRIKGFDCGTKKEIMDIFYINREGAMSRYVKCIGNGMLLHHAWSGEKRGHFIKYCCFIDIYDVSRACRILSIACNSSPFKIRFCVKRNALLLALRENLYLLDIFSRSILFHLSHKEWLHSVDVNAEGDTIVVSDNDNAVTVWKKI